MKQSIFISHNWNDKSFARRIGNDLSRAGARVWIDEGEIKLGDSLIRKISEGIECTDYLGVVLSPESVQSEWVKREVEIAINREVAGKQVKVLPLLYRKCDIPTFLSDKLYADFTNEDNYTKSLNLIKDRLGLPLTEETFNENRSNQIVVHELSNITALIGLATDAARKADKHKDIQQDLETIKSATERQRIILKHFNALNYFQEGRYKLRIEKNCNLSKIVQSSMRFLAEEAKFYNIAFEINIPQKKPIVPADPTLIELVLQELLHNAIKYSHHSTKIRVNFSRGKDDIKVLISNHGGFFSENETDKIFKQGYRTNHARMSQTSGNGIGLFFVKQIIRAHGGNITATIDKKNKSLTTFMLEFPLQY